MGRPGAPAAESERPETAPAWEPPGSRTAASARRRQWWGLRRRRALWPLAALPLGFLLAVAVLTAATRGGRVFLELELTFSPNACCDLTVWLNDTADGPEAVLPIHAGARWVYGLPVHTARISHLRLDPGTVTGSSVVVHGATLRRGDRVLGRLSPSEFRGFGLARATAKARADGIEIRAVAPDPALERDVSLATGTSSARLFLGKVRAEPLPYFVALIVLACLISVPAALASRAHVLLLVSLLGVALLVRSLSRLLWGRRIAGDVDQAVGYSAYTGSSKPREQLLLALTALVAVAIPVAVVASARLAARVRVWHASGSFRRARDGIVAAEARPRVPPPGRRVALLPAATIAFLAVAFAPDLRQALVSARTGVYLPGFDANNLLFWDYLVQKGLVPMKDFFYPYGFQYAFKLNAPWGSLISYASYLAFWSYLVVGTFLVLARLSSGRALVQRFAVAMSVVVLAVVAGYLPGASRYVGALGVVLLFAANERTDSPTSARRAIFMAAFAHVALFEVAQALYALLAIGFLAVLDLAPDVRANRRAMVRAAARTAATLALPAAFVVAVLAVTGQLRGVADFYAEAGALTVAWAAPSRIDHWLTHPDDLAAFVYWAVPVSLTLGVHGVLTRRRPERLGHAVVVALGLVGLMMLQKQVVRPGNETAIWFPAVYGLVFWAVVAAEPRRVRHWAAVFAMVGAAAGLSAVSGGLERGLDSVADGPARLANDVDALATDRDEFAEAARTRFAPSRFAGFAEYRTLVRELHANPAVRAGGSVWTLGDDAVVVTILLGHRWPYYFNTFYDTSPLAWQRKLIRRLEERPPALVVWNRRVTAFDGVPHVVRVPLIFEWAVESLVPERTVGPFEILRARRPGQPVALGWWRQRLGFAVDLGHIPAAANGGGVSCDSGPSCGSYLRVEFTDLARVPPRVALPVTVGALPFQVEFSTSPGVARYVIPLDRVWFWSAAPESAARAVAAGAVASARVSLVRRTRPAGVLY